MLRLSAGLFAGILIAFFAAPASAQVPIVMAASWDGPDNDLQSILDDVYGPGLIDVDEDYIGAKAGDRDPCVWDAVGIEGFVVAEKAGFGGKNVLGWYEDTGSPPPFDTGARVLLPGSAGPGDTFSLFVGSLKTIGFYMNPNGGGGAPNAPEPECFYSNRFFNDEGRDGSQRFHAPFDGDPQCLEDHDYGGLTFGGSLQETDNDFNDLVIQFTILHPTPVRETSFGAVKAQLRGQ